MWRSRSIPITSFVVGRPPYKSNFYCHPGRAEGTPMLLGIILERQLADLGVQRLHVDRRWRRSIAAAWTKNIGSPFLKLALPLRDLVRMDVEMFSPAEPAASRP
jgi:hypothetical protein